MTPWMLSVLLLVAPAPEGLESQPLPGATDAAAWYTAESAVTADPARRRPDGGAAIHYHVPIDHKTGEPNYPIGWPRTGLAGREPWDWTAWDYLEFWVYTETSRDVLPNDALGVTISMPDRGRQYTASLPVVKDEWVRVQIPIEDLVNPAEVTRWQLHVTEARYRDGDTVDFDIADVSLWRYTQPALLAFRPLERVVATESTYVPVEVHVVGIAEGAEEPAVVLVRVNGRDVARAAASVTRGRRRFVLPLPAGLPAGDVELALRFAGSDRDAASAPLSLVAGPFAEK